MRLRKSAVARTFGSRRNSGCVISNTSCSATLLDTAIRSSCPRATNRGSTATPTPARAAANSACVLFVASAILAEASYAHGKGRRYGEVCCGGRHGPGRIGGCRGTARPRRTTDRYCSRLDARGGLVETARDGSGRIPRRRIVSVADAENVPPHEFHEARRRMADAVAVAVAKRGVRHVAMLSAIAAVLPDGNRPAKDLHYCENRLRACGATLTAVRACYFQDNVASVLTPSGADPAHSGDLSPSTGASIGSLGCLEFIREDPDADIRAVAVSVPLQPVG